MTFYQLVESVLLDSYLCNSLEDPTVPLLRCSTSTSVHSLYPYKGATGISDPEPGLLRCNWTPVVNPRGCEACGHSVSSRVIISRASSSSHNSCCCPAAGDNSLRGTNLRHVTAPMHKIHTYAKHQQMKPAVFSFRRCWNELQCVLASVYSHHCNGKPTKTFISQQAAQQKLHKHADNFLRKAERGKGQVCWKEQLTITGGNLKTQQNTVFAVLLSDAE